MKASRLIKVFSILAVLGMAVMIVSAQQAAAPAQKIDWSKQIRIGKFIGAGRQTEVKTPTYTTSVRRSPTREQDWYQAWVQYDTAPEWIDEIVFSYYVLAKRKVQGRDAFSLYRKTIKYIDVPKGRDHLSVAYLRPNAVKRYGEIVAAAVEITVDGELAAQATEVKLPNMPEKWWKNPNVVESAAVTVRDGYLLDRSQTPFAFINVDDYEVIK